MRKENGGSRAEEKEIPGNAEDDRLGSEDRC